MTSLQRRRLPYLAINLALQHKMSIGELTTEFLSEICGNIISMNAMQQAFQLVLDDISDLILDVPKAPEVCITSLSYATSVKISCFL